MSETAATPRVVTGLGVSPPTVPGQTQAPALPLDRRTYRRALDCVHCGLCLPACPTYTQNGLEADSPRGRIYLMKGLADGRIQPTRSVLNHLDLCLDCRACETACPSGVVYHELIEESRTRLATQTPLGWGGRITRALSLRVLPYPTRLKLALLGPRLLQRLGVWDALGRAATTLGLPPSLVKMHDMLPQRGPLWERRLALRYPAAQSPAKATVGFFAGCIGGVLYQEVNRQAIALLQMAGCNVLVPRMQACCGAIHHHSGQTAPAHQMARRNVDAFLGPRDAGDGVAIISGAPSVATAAAVPAVDFIVTDIAGCGAMLKDYPHLLRDDRAYAPRAEEFAAKVRDISEVLVQLRPPRPRRTLEATVAYHDACHLAHAQHVTDAPRQLLQMIPGLKLVPLPEADTCCGAAGTYNLSQPGMARDLAERKIRRIQATGAGICAAGNVGCIMQIQSEADRLGVKLEVVHPVTLLHRAYFG